MRIAIDCANGATTTIAPASLSRSRVRRDHRGLRARWPQHQPASAARRAPELLARTVVDGQHRLGIAFDGDGDRAIFVDASGRVVDGDAVIYMCARRMKAEGRLKGNAVVATVMSNIGLELALRDAGIEMVRCPVGDKYVMEEMLKRGLSLGGEQSGHIIFSEYLFTGDGLATALNVLRTMAGERQGARRAGVGAHDVSAGAAESARAARSSICSQCRPSPR